MSLATTIKSWFGGTEGQPRPGPWLTLDGWLPAEWGKYWNYWQMGYNPLPSPSASIVEACVWAYIRAIAQLPGYHRRQLDNGGVETVTTTALSRILRTPNWYMTQSDFMVHLVRSLLLDGNSYWPVVRNDRNEIIELHWTNPRDCRVVLLPVEGQREREVFYQIGDNPVFDPLSGEALYVPARDMLHFKLLTPRSPLVGESWLSALQFELMNRMAIQQSTADYYQNAAQPSGIIMTERTYPPEQVAEFKRQFREQSAGRGMGGVPFLQSNLKFQQINQTSSKDAETIEALKLNDRTICAVFGVPPILVGIQDGAPAKTSEAVMTEWLASGLGFLINHLEVQFDHFLGLPRGEYTEYDTQALLRSLFRERIEGLARGVQAGVFSPNEARQGEGLPAKKGGDEPRVQQQMVPLSFALEPPAPPVPPAAPAPSPEPEEEEETDEEEARRLEAFAIAEMTKHVEDFRRAG